MKRIQAFADMTNSGIKTINPLLSYLSDFYFLRDILAHRAGLVDQFASQSLVNLSIAPGEKIILSPSALIELAAPVIKIAEFIDRKTISEHDPSTGQHRPEVLAEIARRRPKKTRPSQRT